MAEIIGGLVFPAAQETVQINGNVFNVDERTDLAVEAYKDLGMVHDAGKTRYSIGQNMAAYHDALAEDGYTPAMGKTLEVFQSIDLPAETEKGRAFQALKVAFDARQTHTTDYYNPIWNQYSSGELNRRDFSAAVQPAAATEGVFGKVLAMQHDTDYAGEPGLRFVNQKVKEQVKSAQAEKRQYDNDHQHTELLVVNPADYIVLDTQRRIEGRPDNKNLLLDQASFTRFIQLVMKSAGGHSWLLDAFSSDSRLTFRGSYDCAYSRVGARLLVGPKAQPLSA